LNRASTMDLRCDCFHEIAHRDRHTRSQVKHAAVVAQRKMTQCGSHVFNVQVIPDLFSGSSLKLFAIEQGFDQRRYQAAFIFVGSIEVKQSRPGKAYSSGSSEMRANRSQRKLSGRVDRFRPRGAVLME